MKKILLILLLSLTGLGAGVGAGLALRPAFQVPDKAAEPCGEPAVSDKGDDTESDTKEKGDADFVKLSNQFVIPVVDEARVSSLVVLSLSLQIAQGTSDAVYKREPKLRDAFLQVMFDHANAGGFDGAFTKSGQLNALRGALRETAQKVVGSVVEDVLILDIVRQDS